MEIAFSLLIIAAEDLMGHILSRYCIFNFHTRSIRMVSIIPIEKRGERTLFIIGYLNYNPTNKFIMANKFSI